tara:strand:- start:3742 stop:4263 length:522 start_codon:yes stop_codon:yes gene_type:complete
MVYFWIDSKNEKWDNEMEILNTYSIMKENKEVVTRQSIYYPRLKDTKKRGRYAFIELYKKLCVNEKDKTRYMDIDMFELMICRHHKDYKIHIQPTNRYGEDVETMWILETEQTEHNANYTSRFDFVMTPELPYQHKEQDKVLAIKTLIENLNPNNNELIKLVKFLVEELEQSS